MLERLLKQMAYGFLFDGCSEAVYMVLILTDVIVGMIGVGAVWGVGSWRQEIFRKLLKVMKRGGQNRLNDVV